MFSLIRCVFGWVALLHVYTPASVVDLQCVCVFPDDDGFFFFFTWPCPSNCHPAVFYMCPQLNSHPSQFSLISPILSLFPFSFSCLCFLLCCHFANYRLGILGRPVHPVGSSQFCAFVLLATQAWKLKHTHTHTLWAKRADSNIGASAEVDQPRTGIQMPI